MINDANHYGDDVSAADRAAQRAKKAQGAKKMLIERCKFAADYLGTRQPRCDGGKGCMACWKIYAEKLISRSEYLRETAELYVALR